MSNYEASRAADLIDSIANKLLQSAAEMNRYADQIRTEDQKAQRMSWVMNSLINMMPNLRLDLIVVYTANLAAAEAVEAASAAPAAPTTLLSS